MDTFPESSTKVASAYRWSIRGRMLWIVLRSAYLTVDWVVSGDEEERSYGAKEHDPLGDKVKLFKFCLQQGGTASWIAGTHQH